MDEIRMKKRMNTIRRSETSEIMNFMENKKSVYDFTLFVLKFHSILFLTHFTVQHITSWSSSIIGI